MDNIIFTQLSVQEVRNMLKDEIRQALKEFSQNFKPGDSEDDLLTIQDVSKKLHLAIPSIYGLVHGRLIPFIKRGKKLIFEKSQIEEWLKTGRQKTHRDVQAEADKYLDEHPQ